jgi:methylase of polypeptide subunit release factors
MTIAQESVSKLAATERKATGAHYTPQALAAFVASQILAALQLNDKPKPIRILDPAMGDGELLNAILNELPSSLLQHAIVDGFDTNAVALAAAQDRLSKSFPTVAFNLSNEDFLAVVGEHYLNSQGGLFAPTAPLYDAVIANPPYVRTQVMGATESQRLSKQFGLTGRVDLYHAFLESIAQVLRVDGVAGIICSNRFMTTRSGATVRQRLAEQFTLFHIWDLGDTRLFEAAVLPAVLLLTKKNSSSDVAPSRFTSIYSADGQAQIHEATPLTALNHDGLVAVNGDVFRVRHGVLNYQQDPVAVWTLSNSESDDWLETVVAHTHSTFGKLGKIRVGVKTTADKVFTRSDWDSFPSEKQPELLLPLITHYVVNRFRIPSDAVCPKILYTHQVVNGKRTVVDLALYPKSHEYLKEHRQTLEARHYVIEAGRKWFEIWVPQNPDAWANPKLVFPDIAEKPTFCMDLGGSVVNGDCYWIAPTDKKDLDILWLALAVGNSSFIEEFYDHKFNNKLYAGRRRFMTQYVEQFPLPDPTTPLSRKIISKTKQIYEALASMSEGPRDLISEVDGLIWTSFGFSRKEISRKRDLQLLVQNAPSKLRKSRKEISASGKKTVGQRDPLSLQPAIE